MAAPWLFNEVIDWTMSRVNTSTSARVGEFVFADMDYADDAVVLVSKEEDLPAVLYGFTTEAAMVGLCPSWRKTKIQNAGAGDSPQSLRIDNEAIESVESFTISEASSILMGTTLQTFTGASGWLDLL